MKDHYKTIEIDDMHDWERRAYQRDLAMTLLPIMEGRFGVQWVQCLKTADLLINAEHEHERKNK